MTGVPTGTPSAFPRNRFQPYRLDAAAHPGVAIPPAPPHAGTAVIGRGIISVGIVAIGVRSGERATNQGAGNETARSPSPTPTTPPAAVPSQRGTGRCH